VTLSELLELQLGLLLHCPVLLLDFAGELRSFTGIDQLSIVGPFAPLRLQFAHPLFAAALDLIPVHAKLLR
jgi:hypothetical protein